MNGIMTSKSIQVVMIDDDEDDFKIVKDLLDQGAYNTYEVVWVNSFDEGLRRMNNDEGDVFLIDYNLGERTGLDLIELADAKSLSKPIIMLTGMEAPEIDLSAMEAGATYFVQKANLIVDHLLERTIRYAIKTAKDFQTLHNVDRMKIEMKAAEASNETKSLFLATMSHEIRTPLGAILGFADLAKRTESEEEKNGYLEIIDRNAKHLLVLVNDILDLAKIDAGKFEFTIAACDWRYVIREVVETLRLTAARRNNEIKFVDDESIPRFLMTDAHCLKQILINLIGNASKFTQSGKIEIRVVALASELKFFIHDTGIGMTPEQQSRLFQPFTQGEASLHRRFGGTGLGLHLSRRMAQSLKGNLNLDSSQAGAGSTFVVTLPAVWCSSFPHRCASLDSEPLSLTGLSVLLAEDSEDNQLLVERLLARHGATVEIAADGNEAATKARQGKFDVILMDIQMPEMDGYQATKVIRTFDKQTPIIALSAHAMSGTCEKALAFGFSDYLTKPIESRKLVSTLRRYYTPGFCKTTVNVEPMPLSLCTDIEPPHADTIL